MPRHVYEYVFGQSLVSTAGSKLLLLFVIVLAHVIFSL